ncbi:MAG: MarC family protein [Methanocellales archaeon]|nr:MarC family protein [Methanocellales archaeon]
MIEIFGFFRAFVALLIIVDPFGNLPIFISLTEGLTESERLSAFRTATLAGLTLLILFVFAGTAILHLFGITLQDFTIAGGILLLVIAIKILVGEKWTLKVSSEEVGAVPLACPLLTGPGAITTTMVLMGTVGWLNTLLGVFACFGVTWITLKKSAGIYNFLGKSGTLIIAKITAILIAAIAIQFIRRGIEGAWIL